MNIPEDPILLLSFINMKLRDFYPSLAALCEDLSLREEDIREKLAAVGYDYSEERNAFL